MMRRETAILSANNPGDLYKPPHVLSEFLDMLTGERQLSSERQEQRWNHLAGCIHCQVFLGSYLVNALNESDTPDEAKKSTRELLTQLAAIIHETLKADMLAYIDESIERGNEAANNQFPLFAEHLQSCHDCQAAVQDLQRWFKQ
jgi:hypothetical protein